MNDDVLLSNTATGVGVGIGDAFALGLVAWKDAIDRWISALHLYARETGDTGPQLLGGRWPAAGRLIEQTANEIPTLDEAGRKSASDLFAALVAIGDAYDNSCHRLDAATDVYLDPNVRSAVASGMSLTYSENLASLVAAVRTAAAEAKTRQHSVTQNAAAAGATFADSLSAGGVSDVYGRSPVHGGVATELYMGVLICLHSPQAEAMLEAAKDTALGGLLDTREAAEIDSRTLAEYHPLQAMGYYSSPSAATDAPTVDLTLPQARSTTRYDLAPLIDRRRAQSFGPLATTVNGLGYRLVERLRTINVEPLTTRSHANTGTRGLTIVDGPILVSTDGGRSTHALGGGKQIWAPFAGAKPRVGLYADASEAIILDRLRNEWEAGWGPDLRLRYETAIGNKVIPPGDCDTGTLVNALVAEFEKVYDAAPPVSVHEFRALVVPDTAGPDTYICAAVAQVGTRVLDGRLRSALYISSPRVPYADLERESRLTQMVHVLDPRGAAPEIRRRIGDAFRPDADPFTLTGIRRKETLMRLFRRFASESMGDTPSICSPPSLKLYAASASALAV